MLASSSTCKEISCVLSVLVVILSQLEHSVEAIWPWNNCEIGSLREIMLFIGKPKGRSMMISKVR